MPSVSGRPGPEPTGSGRFRPGTIDEANELLRREHYLGPVAWGCFVLCQCVDELVVGCQVWKPPTSRHLPRHWLELSRWCLTPAGGPNAGSRMHGAAIRQIRSRFPAVTTLVSYSDPSVGHTGALYRACNWHWRPTWLRLVPPPTGGGTWDGRTRQAPKDRWIFELRSDDDRGRALFLAPRYAALAARP